MIRWWLHVLFDCHNYSYVQDRCICWLCKLIGMED